MWRWRLGRANADTNADTNTNTNTNADTDTDTDTDTNADADIRVAHYLVTTTDWARYNNATGPQPLLTYLLPTTTTTTPSNAPQQPASTPLLDTLRAQPPARRRRTLIDELLNAVKNVLGIDPDLDVDPRTGLMELGLTSVMAGGVAQPAQRGSRATGPGHADVRTTQRRGRRGSPAERDPGSRTRRGRRDRRRHLASLGQPSTERRRRF